MAPLERRRPRFPPIGSYGFLSDCHTSALVSFDGAVEWLCLPRFDSPSAFAALLDRGAGHFKLGPRGVVVPISRRYDPGHAGDRDDLGHRDRLAGRPRRAHDRRVGRRATAPAPSPTEHESDHSLLRTITCIDGEVEMEMECLPRFDYGAEAATWSGGELGEAVARGDDGELS